MLAVACVGSCGAEILWRAGQLDFGALDDAYRAAF